VDEQVAESVEPAAPSEEVSDFRASLPEDLREHSALQPIQDVENLAKAYVNASSMIGKDKVVLPGEHASAEDWAAVYDRLGRPEDADSYNIDAGESADDGMLNWFQSTAHDIGLNNAQAQQLVTAYNEMASSQTENIEGVMEAAHQETQAVLQKEFGAKFEDNIENAGALLEQFGPELSENIDNMILADGSRLGDHPEFIKTFVNISNFIQERVSEDELIGIEKTPGAMSPDEARTKLTEIERPDGPLWDRAHPQHEFFVQERSRLYGFMFPEAG
jgi:hypothetical protein